MSHTALKNVTIYVDGFCQLISMRVHLGKFLQRTSQQTHHVYSTLKRREDDRFHAVLTRNTRSVFVELLQWIAIFILYSK